MCIVHLNDYFLMKFTNIRMLFLIFLKQSLKTCGDEEILLFQTEFFSRIMIVVRIKNVNDQFRKIFLLYRLMVISSVKFIKLKICDRFCIPHTQCVYDMISISYDRHIIRNRQNRLIIFLHKFCFSRLRVIFKPDIPSEADFFCIFFSSDLERITFFEPVIRHFHLIPVFNLLFKHAVTITNAASISRIIQCCK